MPPAAPKSTATAPAPRLSVGFVLADRFTLTAFANFVDTLRLAADEGDRSRPILCRWSVMSASGRPARASCGVTVAPDSPLRDPGEFTYVVVVGGLLHRGPAIDPATAAWLKRAAKAGATLVGVCTGSFILARLGLLAGRRACVSWYHRQDWLDEFGAPEPIADQLYLIDGKRITCSGGAGVVDLAAALVERHVGQAAARKALNVMLREGSRAATAPQPAPAVAPLREAGDARVRRAMLLMEQSLAGPGPVGRIAVAVGLSERQLDRLFRAETGASPAQVWRGMRVDYGRWLIVEGGRSVFEAAALAGFADGAHFARAYRARYGAPPSSLRGVAAAAPGGSARGRRVFAQGELT